MEMKRRAANQRLREKRDGVRGAIRTEEAAADDSPIGAAAYSERRC